MLGTPRIYQALDRIGVDVSYVVHDFRLRTVSRKPITTAPAKESLQLRDSRVSEPTARRNKVAADEPSQKTCRAKSKP